MMFMLLLVLGSIAYLLGNLTQVSFDRIRTQKTQQALVEARDALLGYAAQYREQQIASGGTPDAMYGYLPLPDFGESFNLNASFSHPCASEGCAKMNATGLSGSGVLVGRFPWKTVGTGPLRDGHGECLWYAVTASHRSINSTAAVMNWDTLGTPDILIGSGRPDLSALNEHDRPIAVIFSPGPAILKDTRTDSAEAPLCGGNYDSAHYVNPDDLNNTQQALPITSDMIYSLLRKSAKLQASSTANRPPSFRDDIKEMFDKIAICARDQIYSGATNGPVSNQCSIDLDNSGPRGYFVHYRDQVFVAKCSACQVTIDELPVTECAGVPLAGVLLFGNQRGSGQNRRDGTEKANPGNYLENHDTALPEGNLESYNSGGNIYRGASIGKFGPIKGRATVPADVARCGTGYWKTTPECQTANQDIIGCIPSGASMTTVSSPSLGANQLAAYNAATRTLTLGRADIESDLGYPAAALYGCAWLADLYTLGSGMRSYFRFQFKKLGSSVGANGFVFTMADATRNNFLSCGAAGSHLAYSGSNGTTPKIDFPKIGIEFDQGRNTGLIENADPTLSGRNDPCGASSCGGTVGYNSHAAIVYWGHESAGADGVTMPDYDDNVHGFPTSPAGSRPPPSNPAAAPGIRFVNMRGYPDSTYDSRVFHVRVEISQVLHQLESARVASGANIDLTSPGAVIDGLAMSAGNRVLVGAQASPADNGIYIWSGASTPMTRATDADTGAEITEASVQVLEGTYAGPSWVQTLAVANIGTSPQNWQPHVRRFRTEAWIEGDASLTGEIAALKNTNRPMSFLYPAYASTLSDTATLYPFAGAACGPGIACPSGQTCGNDNLCYRPPMQSVQLGFTGSQRTTDQEVTINDFFATWLP